MANYKGDSNYRPFYDDVWASSAESDEEPPPQDTCRRRREWTEQHFDVLMELYRAFKSNGESAFGRAFYQFGDFHHFVSMIYEKTTVCDDDLLKPKTVETHVSALGLSARSKHRLSVVQTAKSDGATGGGCEGVRRSWSEAVKSVAA